MKTSSMVKSAAAHVLLVDDNRDGLLARKALLQEQGMTITTSTNGEDAFEVFIKGKFDLLVTDFKMPKMNGVELIRRIRPLQPNMGIILLSGFVDTLGLDEQSTGADVVINKGAHEIPHLLRAAARLLSRQPAKKPPASQKKALKAKAKSV
jgi:CheY-like chemotaxis protein